MQTNPIGAGSLLGASVNQSATQLGSVARVPTRPQSPFAQQAASEPAQAPKKRALSILSQEIRQILSARFSLRFAAALPAYSLASEPISAAAVGDDAQTAARALARRSPLEAGESLGDLRREIEDVADDVRELAGDDELDDAMELIRSGIGGVEEDAARNVASSATVLSYESELKQRSTIRIRTQEGDIVRFDLKRLEQMSASDVALSDGSSSFTATEVEMSSRMRTVLTVNGDLNEAEFAAIQDVFAQAEAIAAEFFDGDLAKAFDMASGIEFDSDQLARVKMRFREQMETNFSFASIRSVAPPPPEIAPAPIAEPEPVSVGIPVPEQLPSLTPAPPEAAADPAAADDGGIGPAVPESALDGFLRLLSDFLRSTNDGFETGTFRFFYSESFRLDILKSMIEVAAPDASGDAPRTAAALIDGLSDSEADGS